MLNVLSSISSDSPKLEQGVYNTLNLQVFNIWPAVLLLPGCGEALGGLAPTQICIDRCGVDVF
jgi:hypothetical protein